MDSTLSKRIYGQFCRVPAVLGLQSVYYLPESARGLSLVESREFISLSLEISPWSVSYPSQSVELSLRSVYYLLKSARGLSLVESRKLVYRWKSARGLFPTLVSLSSPCCAWSPVCLLSPRVSPWSVFGRESEIISLFYRWKSARGLFPNLVSSVESLLCLVSSLSTVSRSQPVVCLWSRVES